MFYDQPPTPEAVVDIEKSKSGCEVRFLGVAQAHRSVSSGKICEVEQGTPRSRMYPQTPILTSISNLPTSNPASNFLHGKEERIIGIHSPIAYIQVTRNRHQQFLMHHETL